MTDKRLNDLVDGLRVTGDPGSFNHEMADALDELRTLRREVRPKERVQPEVYFVAAVLVLLIACGLFVAGSALHHQGWQKGFQEANEFCELWSGK